MKKFLHVIGTRPNFIKIAPIKNELDKYSQTIKQYIVHTGQHYDINMSEKFFSDLKIPKPNYNLNIGSGTNTWQISMVMIELEKLILKINPDLVIVFGDVNATLAAALVCSKLNIKIAHIEAGLRSNDKTMPEEVNRILTDQVSDFLFTPSLDANENLLNEGINPSKIYFVGNIMIDSLSKNYKLAKHRFNNLKKLLKIKNYLLLTLHRPSNVDQDSYLLKIIREVIEVSNYIEVIFPVHPRTKEKFLSKHLSKLLLNKNIKVIEPQGYLDFLSLQIHAKIILTDSGGIQEESTYLGVPCITLRKNTERPITITQGTNFLMKDIDGLSKKIHYAKNQIIERKKNIPKYWDGKTSKRIVEVLKTV